MATILDRTTASPTDKQPEGRRDQATLVSGSVSDFVAVLDLDGETVYATLTNVGSGSEKQSPGTADPFGEVHPEDREKLQHIVKEAIRSGIEQRCEYRALLADGRVRFVETQANLLWDEHGKASRVVVVSRDITDRKLVEDNLRQLSRAVEQSPALIVITDTRGNIEYVNPKFCQVTGYTAEEVVGKNPRILKSGEMSIEGYKHLWETITSGGEWRGEFHNKKKSGELYWEFASVSPIRDAQGRVTHFLAVKEDVTIRKRIEEERIKLVAELQQALAKVKTLSGLLPICAWCKKVRDDEGYWKQIESYVEAHSDAEFTHGICPDCAEKRRLAIAKAGKNAGHSIS